jgi:hypothetical protein
MKSQLIDLLEDQGSVNFTGRVNILSSNNNQLLGVIILYDGLIIEVNYKSFKDFKAIVSIYLDSVSNNDLKFIVEPEIIEKKELSKTINPLELKSQLSVVAQEYLKYSKMRPSGNICLLVSEKIFEEKSHLSVDEYDVLKLIINYPKVNDLYKNCEKLDYEITKTLVTLREKKYILVTK